MILRDLFWTIALGVAIAAAQTADGQIAGRINDKAGAPLPGVRVTITNGDQSREAITDSAGRFAVRSLTIGTYRLVAELAGFKAASGEITVSPSTPRAFLAWSLEVGCLAERQRVILGPRDAARLVEAIVHLRVASTAGPVLMSVRPDCEGQMFREYSVQVLGTVSGRDRTGPAQRQMFMEPLDALLTPGQEYLALLWPDGYTTDDLVLPIVSGRVVSPGAGELNGLRANEALNILAKWSEERQR